MDIKAISNAKLTYKNTYLLKYDSPTLKNLFMGYQRSSS